MNETLCAEPADGPRGIDIEICDERQTAVSIERSVDDRTETIEGRLIDISRGGAKVSVPCCVPYDETVRLSITLPDVGHQFTVPAKVAWSRPNQIDGWLIGCSFVQGLPDESVEQLVAGGYCDPRRSPRYPISVEATACWELSDTKVPAWLQDFSTSGFCMLCTRSGENGQRVRIEIEQLDGQIVPIAAKTRWSVQVDDGYLVGCEFLSGHDFHHLWDVTYRVTPNQPVQPRVTLPQSRWMLVWFAATLAFILAYPFLIAAISSHRSDASSARPTAASITSSASVKSSATDKSPSTDRAREGPPDLAGFAHALTDRAEEGAWAAEKEAWRADQARQRAELDARAASLRAESEHRAADGRDQQRQLAAQREQVRRDRTQIRGERQQLVAERATWEAQRRQWQEDRTEREAEQRQFAQARAAWQRDRQDHRQAQAAWEAERAQRLAATAAAPESVGEVPAPAPGDRPSGPGDPAPEVTQVDRNDAGVAEPDAWQRAVARDPLGDDVRERADALRARGRALLAQGDYRAAAHALLRSARADETNPMVRYLLAMAQYQMNRGDEAQQTVLLAARLERERPIQGWGRRMQRYQGSARVWLERARGLARQ